MLGNPVEMIGTKAASVKNVTLANGWPTRWHRHGANADVVSEPTKRRNIPDGIGNAPSLSRLDADH